MTLVSLKNSGDVIGVTNNVCLKSTEFKFSKRLRISLKVLSFCLTLFLLLIGTVKAQRTTINYSLGGPAGEYTSLFLKGGAALTSGVADAEGSGWLRLGEYAGARKGYCLIDKAIPAAEGFSVQFDYKIYKHAKATTLNPDLVDGLCVFLYDGSVTKENFSIGGDEAALGYSPNLISNPANKQGISKAYLGVGIDSDGSFGTIGLSSANSKGSSDTAVGNVVTVRGPYNRVVKGNPDPYGYIASSIYESSVITPFVLTANGARPSDADMYRRIKIVVAPNANKTDYNVTVYMQNDPNQGFYTVINNQPIGSIPPANLKVGISAIVNNAFVIEAKNLEINSPASFQSPANVIAETAKPQINNVKSGVALSKVGVNGAPQPATKPEVGAINPRVLETDPNKNNLQASNFKDARIQQKGQTFNLPLTGSASAYPSLTLQGGASCTSAASDADGNGWLRLGDQAAAPKGYALIDKPFVSAEGLNVQFDYKIYKNAQAKTLNPDAVDGFCVFLYDGTVPQNAFNIGGAAEALGYSPNVKLPGAANTQGVSKAYLGVGIDSDGSFGQDGISSPNSAGAGSKAVGNVVTVRGSYNKTLKGKSDPYGYIASSINEDAPIIPFILNQLENGRRPTDADMFRRVKVSITPNADKTDYQVAVYMQDDPNKGFYNVVSSRSIGQIPPATLKLGLSAMINNPFTVEMRNLEVTTVTYAPTDYVIAKAASKPVADAADILTYTIEVRNAGSVSAGDEKVTINDTLPEGLALVEAPTFTPIGGQPSNFQYSGFDSKGALKMSVNLPPNASGNITYKAKINDPKSISLVSTASIVPPNGSRDINSKNNSYTTQVLVKPSMLTTEATVPSNGKKTIALQSIPANANSTYSWTAVQDGNVPVSGFQSGKGKTINQSLATQGTSGKVVYTVKPTAVVPRILANGTVSGTINIAGDSKNLMVKVVTPPTFTLSKEQQPIAYGTLPANLANPTFVSQSNNADYYKFYDSTGKKELKVAQVPAGDYYIQACSEAGFCSDRKPIRVKVGPQPTIAMRIDKNSLIEGENANIILSLSPSTVKLQEPVTFVLECAHSQLNSKNQSANPLTLWPSPNEKSIVQQADCAIPSTVTFPAGVNTISAPVQTLADNVLYDDELLLLRAYNPYIGRAINSLSIEDATELNPDNLAITIDGGIAHHNDTLKVAARLPYGITTAKDITVYLSEDKNRSNLSNLSERPIFPASVTIPGDKKTNATEFDVIAANANNAPAKLVLLGSCAGCNVNEAQIAIAGQREPTNNVLAANNANVNKLPAEIAKYPNNEVQIVNRWGVIVYEAKGYDNNTVVFNGRSNRGYIYDLPAGTYYYRVRLGENKSAADRITGSLEIVRPGESEG